MKITEIGHRISETWSRFTDRCWGAVGHLTKPAILVMMGIGGCALLYPTILQIVQARQMGLALERHAHCQQQPDTCMKRQLGTLDGPRSSTGRSRHPGKEWTFTWDAHHDLFSLDATQSAALQAVDPARAIALMFNDEVAAIEISPGHAIPMQDVGTRGIVMWTFGAILLAAFSDGLIRYGISKRRRTKSWWQKEVAPHWSGKIALWTPIGIITPGAAIFFMGIMAAPTEGGVFAAILSLFVSIPVGLMLRDWGPRSSLG